MAEKPKRPSMVTKFCFTLNNYTDEEYVALTSEEFTKKCKFLVIGKETGANGTPHLQGYVNLVKKMAFNSLKKLVPRAHIEKANGNDEQNYAYCTKDDKNAFVYGEIQFRGKRNDLRLACNMIINKAPMAEVAKEYPCVYVQYNKGLVAFREILQPDRDPDDPPSTVWLWGLAGVGKTRLVFDQSPKGDVYVKDGTQWWDGYSHQSVVLIDDFDGHWPYRDFLRLLDRYPYQGQFKGGYVKINSPIIVITCEFPPEHFWQGNELAQVTRRLEQVVHME